MAAHVVRLELRAVDAAAELAHLGSALGARYELHARVSAPGLSVRFSDEARPVLACRAHGLLSGSGNTCAGWIGFAAFGPMVSESGGG